MSPEAVDEETPKLHTKTQSGALTLLSLQRAGMLEGVVFEA